MWRARWNMTMKITDIQLQARNPNRVNVSVDGAYRFSLDVYQVGELGIKVGRLLDEQVLARLEGESEYGKLYARALEYCLMRPHSVREVRDYLWRKTRTTKVRSKKTGELYDRKGVSHENAERVLLRLTEKGYADDEKFTRFWVENRNQTKGSSLRKLTMELRAKGVDPATINRALSESERSDGDEIKKMIEKKRRRYPDDQKLMQYLLRQGFGFDDVKSALEDIDG